jgi:hypothetical protein
MKSSPKTLANLLNASLQATSSPSFILLDAYDEFRNTGDEEVQRSALCSFLSEICHYCSVKILVTTRPQCRQDLKEAFPSSAVAVVKGDLADVETYLENRIQPLKRIHEQLKANIKRTILEANQDEAWYK